MFTYKDSLKSEELKNSPSTSGHLELYGVKRITVNVSGTRVETLVDAIDTDNGGKSLSIIELSEATAKVKPIWYFEEEILSSFYKEKQAFLRIKKSLLEKYKNKYVAIHNGEVVDSDVSESKLIEKFYKKYGDVSVYIDQVAEEKRVITIATPFFPQG